MSSYTYYKTKDGFTVLPAFIEDSIDCGTCLCFEKRLNANYGSYAKCSISIPSDLLPEICENVYGEKMLALNALGKGIVLAPEFSSFPLFFLPVKDGYTYFDIEHRNEDDRKVGKTIRVRCKIEEES